MKQLDIFNKERPLGKKQETFVRFAKQLAKLSKCKNGKVGAILVDTDFTKIFSIGINGGPAKQDNCVCNSALSKYGCVHAEQNCLVKNNDSIIPKIMICTKECCVTCASLIINSDANITEFWYIEDYKDHRGLDILIKADIMVSRIE